MPDRASNRFNMLRRAPELIFMEPALLPGISMANHCLSWHLVHSTSFWPITPRLLPPQARQATRSASLWPRLGIVVTCGVTARRRSTTSTGEIAPDLRFTCRLGNGRVSAKFQRTRKSTIRISVLSSTPDAASSSFADCHRCSESADQTTSRNTPFTVSFRSNPSPR